MKTTSGLYITDVPIETTNQVLEEKENTNTDNPQPNKKKAEVVKQMSPTKYLKSNQQEYSKTQDQFLNYIINDQTKFADFNKIESHYSESIVGHFSEINRRKRLIDEIKEL